MLPRHLESGTSEERTFSADWDSLIAAESWFQECSERFGLPSKLKSAIQVCFEELSTNVVSHSVQPRRDGETLWFRVSVKRDGDSLQLTMSDNAMPFDTKTAILNKKDPLADGYRIGGLGLGLVGKMADRIDYRETETGNETTLTFKFLTIKAPQAEIE